ncbi:hypothetical protein R1flu_025008 [Riccia fluitans]|uniref:Uncharacterized protein n=1 Tax=Riccia fluitans TaxID=41844 RepID=A0ABD1XZK6_9MARC
MGWRFTAVKKGLRPKAFWGVRRSQLAESSSQHDESRTTLRRRLLLPTNLHQKHDHHRLPSQPPKFT